MSFRPAISTQAATAIRQTIREWRMASTRNNQSLEDLARLVNPVVRGWRNYYGRFYRSRCVQVLRHLNEALAAWARGKYKRFRRRERASMHWLGCVTTHRKVPAVPEMEEGPPEPPCRRRLQTPLSCCSQKLWW